MKCFAFLTLLLLTSIFAQEPSEEPDQGALPSSVADGVDPVAVPFPRPTIYGYISTSGQHQILKAIFDALPNTSITLDEPGARFTLFAPTDSAFRDLARRVTADQDAPTTEEVIKQLVDGIDSIKRGPGFTDVRGIIFYHLIVRHYTFSELEQFGTVTTAQGKNITFIEGRVRDLDPSRIDANPFQVNIFTQNGWVHLIDSILLPFDLEKAIQISRPSPSPSQQPPPTGTTTDGPATDTPTPTDTDGSPTGPVTVPGTIDASPSPEDPDASPEEENDGICFPSNARVHTPDGPIAMQHLEAGQEVLHHESGKSSNVFLFTHRTQAYEGWFYRITTATGHAVTMTGNHYLYASGRLTAADAILIGDTLRTVNGISPVVDVKRVKATGLYAPHSVHGDLVVDGIVVSGYSRAVRPGIAHAVLAPVRWLVKLTGIREPFGGLFYEGGRGVEKYLPKGKARY